MPPKPKISLSRALFNENEIEVRLSETGELIGIVEEKVKGLFSVTKSPDELKQEFKSRDAAVDFIVNGYLTNETQYSKGCLSSKRESQCSLFDLNFNQNLNTKFKHKMEKSKKRMKSGACKIHMEINENGIGKLDVQGSTQDLTDLINSCIVFDKGFFEILSLALQKNMIMRDKGIGNIGSN